VHVKSKHGAQLGGETGDRNVCRKRSGKGKEPIEKKKKKRRNEEIAKMTDTKGGKRRIRPGAKEKEIDLTRCPLESKEGVKPHKFSIPPQRGKRDRIKRSVRNGRGSSSLTARLHKKGMRVTEENGEKRINTNSAEQGTRRKGVQFKRSNTKEKICGTW